MATTEEKQELVDALSGPRFYRFTLWGYGGESAYIKLNKPAYEFWKAHIDANGDYDLVNYMVSAEDGDYDFEDLEEVPEDANFMFDEDGDPRPWYEHHEELEHQNGVDYNNARVTIEEVAGTEWGAPVVATLVDGEDLAEYCDLVMSEDDYATEITQMGVSEYEDWDAKYVLQFLSSEKGTFFEGLIETTGEFNPKKLMIYTQEYANGDDTITNVEYEGVDIDNFGGDTNGKGYSAYLWEE